MVADNLFTTLASCVFLMALVAWISYQKTKGEVDTRDGYFLAGRGLTGVFIAGSMLLTNLSAEQLIGLNGSGRAPVGLTAGALRSEGHDVMPKGSAHSVTVPNSPNAPFTASTSAGGRAVFSIHFSNLPI